MTPTGRGARSQEPEAIAARERLAEWSKRYSNQVVDGVIYYRDKRGLKNADLIARLGELGWDVTSNTLAGILGKKRTAMPVTDVMLFAAALNVPPVALIFGTHTELSQRLAPNASREWQPYEAAKWFAGTLALPVVEFADPFEDLVDDYYEVGDIVSRTEEVEDALRTFTNAHAHLLAAMQSDAEVQPWRKRAEEALDAVAERRRYLRLFHPNAALPAVRPALAFVDQPKRAWPALPLRDYTTDLELRTASDDRVIMANQTPRTFKRLEKGRQELLQSETPSGEA